MKRLFIPLVVCLSFAVGSLFIHSSTASAAFTANNVADDFTFDNVNTMSAAQIDAFLNSFPSSCISTNHGFSAVDPIGYDPSTNFVYGGLVSAGKVIYDSGQAFGLNPQVILTTLQKEESLVTGTSGCSTWRYTSAVGYGCPDGGTGYDYSGLNLYAINGNVVSSVSGTCVNKAASAGFSQQVIRAAWFFRFAEQRSEGNVGWAVIKGPWNNIDDPPFCYSGPMTQGYRQRCQNGSSVYYDGYQTIDGTSVHMDNGATAALYWYTPHFHGNQSFVAIFESWFGPTTGRGFVLAKSSDTNDLRQWVIYGGAKHYVPSSQTLNAWGLNNVTLNTMDSSSLNSVPTAEPLGLLATLSSANPQAIYFMDGGKRYKIPYWSTYNAWNFGGYTVNNVSDGLFNLATDAGDLSYSIQNPGNQSTSLYMVDGPAAGSNQTVIRPYGSVTAYNAWEGDNPKVINVSSDFFTDHLSSAVGASLSTTKISYGGQKFQVTSGYRMLQSDSYDSLYPGTAQAVSTATINRLTPTADALYMIKSASSPDVYILDNGQKRKLSYADELFTWSTPWAGYRTLNDAYLSLIPTGTAITSTLADDGSQLWLINGTKTAVPAGLASVYRSSMTAQSITPAFLSLFQTSSSQAGSFIKGRDAPSVFLLDSSGHKRLVDSPDRLVLWAGASPSVTTVGQSTVDNVTAGTTASIFVSDGTTEYVMEYGKKLPVPSNVKSEWNLSSAQVYSDGTLSRFTTGDTLTTSARGDQGGYFLIRDGASYGTIGWSLANLWGIDNAPVRSNKLLANFLPNYGLTRLVKSSTDSRTFLIADGNWYNLDGGPLNNYAPDSSEPRMTLDPANAPNTITNWTSFIVKDSSGGYYVIEGGNRNIFPNNDVRDFWTNNGTISAPTVPAGFLQLLSYRGGFLQKAITGQGNSNHYAAQNGTKRIITSPSHYNDYGGTSVVSDRLLDTMTNGTPL